MLWLVYLLASSAPAVDRAVETQELLQFDPDSLMDVKAAWEVSVPCNFCDESITVLLEICKDRNVNAESTSHVQDFLTRCTEIGGLNNNWDIDIKCGDDMSPADKRGMVMYARRLRCSKIYRGLAKMYDPYDPCTQIRTDYQRSPLAVCKSSDIDCGDRRFENVWPPTYNPNENITTIMFQPPPLSCSQYVSKVVGECARIKGNDFYARTNLDGWCESNFNGTYEEMGCRNVLGGMTKRDNFMDLCSGLKILPIEKKEHGSFCESFLKLPKTRPVPVPEYEQYMRVVNETQRMTHYQEMVKNHVKVSKTDGTPLP